eukprot:11696496-Prorocentrum_lima.AAC.1
MCIRDRTSRLYSRQQRAIYMGLCLQGNSRAMNAMFAHKENLPKEKWAQDMMHRTSEGDMKQ